MCNEKELKELQEESQSLRQEAREIIAESKKLF